jgi:hypothetical protein
MAVGTLYLKVKGVDITGVKNIIERMKKEKETKNIITVTKSDEDQDLDKLLGGSTEKSDIMVQFKYDDDATLESTTEKVSGVTGVNVVKRVVY